MAELGEVGGVCGVGGVGVFGRAGFNAVAGRALFVTALGGVIGFGAVFVAARFAEFAAGFATGLGLTCVAGRGESFCGLGTIFAAALCIAFWLGAWGLGDTFCGA